MGGVQNSSGNSKMKKFVKFPPWWGYGYFLELHIHVKLVGFDPSIVSQIGLLEVHLSVLFLSWISHLQGTGNIFLDMPLDWLFVCQFILTM